MRPSDRKWRDSEVARKLHGYRNTAPVSRRKAVKDEERLKHGRDEEKLEQEPDHGKLEQERAEGSQRPSV